MISAWRPFSSQKSERAVGRRGKVGVAKLPLSNRKPWNLGWVRDFRGFVEAMATDSSP